MPWISGIFLSDFLAITSAELQDHLFRAPSLSTTRVVLVYLGGGDRDERDKKVVQCRGPIPHRYGWRWRDDLGGQRCYLPPGLPQGLILRRDVGRRCHGAVVTPAPLGTPPECRHRLPLPALLFWRWALCLRYCCIAELDGGMREWRDF